MIRVWVARVRGRVRKRVRKVNSQDHCEEQGTSTGTRTRTGLGRVRDRDRVRVRYREGQCLRVPLRYV